MFSVVIPCYRNVNLLLRTLAGFCRQDFDAPFEVILVDNNTFDEDIHTAYLKYVQRFPLYLVRQPKLPHTMAPCLARNNGLRLARYDWVINLDSDCILNRTYFRTLRGFLEQHQRENLVIAGLRKFISLKGISDDAVADGSVVLADQPPVRSPSNYNRTVDHRWPDIARIAELDHPWGLIHSCNMVYRRDTAQSIGGYDEAFDGVWGYEDTDFAHRLITQGKARPVFLPDIDVFHQDSELSAKETDRFDKRNNRNWHMIIERIPGIEEFKLRQYERINQDIVTE